MARYPNMEGVPKPQTIAKRKTQEANAKTDSHPHAKNKTKTVPRTTT